MQEEKKRTWRNKNLLYCSETLKASSWEAFGVFRNQGTKEFLFTNPLKF